MPKARNFIAGEWVAASETTPDINPSDTDDIVGHFPNAGAAEAERAIDVDPKMRIAREEIFGPVAGVVRVKDHDEVPEVANDTAFNLCAGIYAKEFYTTVKTAYTFDPNEPYVPKASE